VVGRKRNIFWNEPYSFNSKYEKVKELFYYIFA